MIDSNGPRAIRDNEIAECLEMLNRAFDETPNGFFERYFVGDPWYRNDYCRVYSQDGRIVSSLSICRREVRVGSARLILGGIANVGTNPDDRGKGYSSEVLKDSAVAMDADGMDFSVLYTGINAFYDRVGWRDIPIPVLSGTLIADPKGSVAGDYRLRPYDDHNGPSELLKLYDQFNANRVMTAVRVESLWRNFTMHKFHNPYNIMFAEDASGPVAYALSHLHEGAIQFQELGFMSGHESALDQLLMQAAAQAVGNGITQVQLEPCREPAVISSASRIAEGLDTTPTHYTMIRFFDLPRTFARLVPELSKRVATGDLRGAVTIETEVGSVGLRADGSEVEIVEDTQDTAKLSQADLARLIFGIGPISDEESQMSDDAREFLSSLFPLQPFVYWNTDKF